MKLVKLLCLIIAALLITNVVVANTAVDESVVVKSLGAEIEGLTQEKLKLSQDEARLGSIQNITPRIEAMGFVDAPTIVSLSTPSLASR
jgi:hypothetical protein